MARQEMATRREGERWRWPGHMATKGLACDGGRRRQEGGVNTTISQKRDAQGTGHQSTKDGGGERRVGDSAMGPAMLYFLLRPNLGRP